MMRVFGAVEFPEDIELKAKALRDRPFLKGFGNVVAGRSETCSVPDSEGRSLFLDHEK
jgi:uncharacterized pyridoxamine 5'-phosphate oxidase family protein